MKELNDLKKKLEKEKYFKFEEASKKLSNVELEVESRSCVLEARKKNVEAARAEVLLYDSLYLCGFLGQ